MIKETVTVNSDETGGTWTNSFMPPSNVNQTNMGRFSLSIEGSSFSGTVTLQRSFDNASTWKDYDTYTADAEERHIDTTIGILYRAGCKEGDFTSGSVDIILAK
jgi:hypothetical protein